MSEKAVTLSRLEMQWLHRQVVATRDRLEGKLKDTDTPELRHDLEFFSKMSLEMQDRLNAGDKEKIQIVHIREELEEAITLVEEADAVIEARKRLDNLQKEEEYRLIFGRDQLKFTIKMLEKDIAWLQTKAIPNYISQSAADFEDQVMTKSYYINKAKKAQRILSELKSRLEKEL